MRPFHNERSIDMTFNPDIHRRRSIRLQRYDYSQAGAYFITICTQNRECMFGEIADRKMVPNPAGNMIQTVWDEIPFHYAGIQIDAFAIMPNHIHGIIVIVGATPRGCPVFHPRDCPVSTPDDCPGVSGQARENGQVRENGRGGQARGPAPTRNTSRLFDSLKVGRVTKGAGQNQLDCQHPFEGAI